MTTTQEQTTNTMEQLHPITPPPQSPMTDFRALCAELLAHYDLEWRARERIKAALAEPQGEGPTDDELLNMAEYDHGFDRMDCTDGNREWMTYEATGDKVITFARAAIAVAQVQPAAKSPSDEQILQLSQWHEVSYTMSDGAVIYPMQHGCDMRDAVLSFARAVLTRWGRPTPPATEDSSAAQQGGWPSDGELIDVADLRDAWNAQADAFNTWDELGLDEIICWAQRQALARWGRPAPAPADELLQAYQAGRRDAWLIHGKPVEAAQEPPADGEVGELIRELRDAAFDLNGSDPAKSMLTRAADLLAHLALQPVPVAEKPWEREGWCDGDDQCWMGHPGGGEFIPSWRLCRPEDAPRMSVTLPAHALPLPREVQP